MAETKETLPPQHQDRQPGRESAMTPKPDYAPVFAAVAGSRARWR